MTSETNNEFSMNIEDIINFLPHAYPLLLIDRVTSMDEKKICGYKNVTFNEPHFQGHFPGKPIMPGVLILEAMGQLGGILVSKQRNLKKGKFLIYFVTMDNVKFRNPVIPGDRLDIEMEIIKMKTKIFKVGGQAKVDGKVCAQAEFMAQCISTEE